MKSVKSIQKITKAMKMVAASKLRMDQKRLENGMPFAVPVQRIVNRIPVPEEKTDLTILALTSDKGLCGGVNSAVSRLVRDTVKETEGGGQRTCIIGVGDKVRSALQRVFGDRFSRMLTEATRFPWNFATAAVIADRIIKDDPSRLIVVYNHFRSAVAYDTISLKVLTNQQAAKSAKQELALFEAEPELPELWKDLHDFYSACTVYGCMLDNIASEQSARMSAMDNASTNAGEMISALTLKYNRARQAKITTELVEIISGANALE
ncbi:ATP synthase subunit gamma, mitochondrial [Cyclospora cayetanensis]|nr:ATP synthase subunit gamma, mitochondrial [Cyclospora cayetanensis]